MEHHDEVGPGTGAEVGAGRLARLVGVGLRGPADEVVGVVLEPFRGRRHRDDRQVAGYVLGDGGEGGGLRGRGGGSGQVGQVGVNGGVMDPLVVAGGGARA